MKRWSGRDHWAGSKREQVAERNRGDQHDGERSVSIELTSGSNVLTKGSTAGFRVCLSPAPVIATLVSFRSSNETVVRQEDISPSLFIYTPASNSDEMCADVALLGRSDPANNLGVGEVNLIANLDGDETISPPVTFVLPLPTETPVEETQTPSPVPTETPTTNQTMVPPSTATGTSTPTATVTLTASSTATGTATVTSSPPIDPTSTPAQPATSTMAPELTSTTTIATPTSTASASSTATAEATSTPTSDPTSTALAEPVVITLVGDLNQFPVGATVTFMVCISSSLTGAPFPTLVSNNERYFTSASISPGNVVMEPGTCVSQSVVAASVTGPSAPAFLIANLNAMPFQGPPVWFFDD